MEYEYRTDTGKVREKNEDSIYVQEGIPGFFMVSDGIGGYEGGEIASSIVRDSIMPYWEEVRTGGYDREYQIRQFIRYVNYKIVEKQMESLRLCRMGTTATIIDIDTEDDTLYFGHVGDCRLLIVRDKEMIQLTKDHNEAGELIEMGFAGREELLSNKNRLTRFLGQKEDIDIDTGSFKLAAGDYIFLGTDGSLSGGGNKAIHEIIESFKGSKNWEDQNNLKAMADSILNYNLKDGGKDNITFILIKY